MYDMSKAKIESNTTMKNLGIELKRKGKRNKDSVNSLQNRQVLIQIH